MLLSQVIYPLVCIMSAECVSHMCPRMCLSESLRWRGAQHFMTIVPNCLFLFLVFCKQRWVNMLSQDSFM